MKKTELRHLPAFLCYFTSIAIALGAIAVFYMVDPATENKRHAVAIISMGLSFLAFFLGRKAQQGN